MLLLPTAHLLRSTWRRPRYWLPPMAAVLGMVAAGQAAPAHVLAPAVAALRAPPGFELPQTDRSLHSFDARPVEPDALWVGPARISKWGYDLGPTTLLDDDLGCRDLANRMGSLMEPVVSVAVDSRLSYARLRCLYRAHTAPPGDLLLPNARSSDRGVVFAFAPATIPVTYDWPLGEVAPLRGHLLVTKAVEGRRRGVWVVVDAERVRVETASGNGSHPVTRVRAPGVDRKWLAAEVEARCGRGCEVTYRAPDDLPASVVIPDLLAMVGFPSRRVELR